MTDLTDITGYVRSLIGDTTGSIWATGILTDCIRSALGRYAAAVEHVQTEVIQLPGGGLYGLSLENWAGPALQEIAFLLWPAASTVAASYPTAYHVGMLAEMADDAMREFERELDIIRAKRLERPPWGIAERKRMRRVDG